MVFYINLIKLSFRFLYHLKIDEIYTQFLSSYQKLTKVLKQNGYQQHQTLYA